jgi:Neprosin
MWHPKITVCLRATFVPLVLAAVATGCGQWRHRPEQVAYECVPRSATAKPPPFKGGPKLAGKSASHEERPEALRSAGLLALCAEGLVPVAKSVKPLDLRQQLEKGNPLIGRILMEKNTTLDSGERRAQIIRQNLRPFDSVYRKRNLESTQEPPPDPSGDCNGVNSFNTCYYYGSAAVQRDADGGGMTMHICSPAYDGSGGSGHTLDEIAVQGGDGDGNIVELGWNVSTSQYTNANPHLFVYHWKNWEGTCYDGCGWQQYSSTYFPGMDLGSLTGRQVYLGYVFWQGNWWAWFDNQWLGYFPGSEWDGKYARNSKIQWFGEVATHNGLPPRTDMGGGLFPANTSAPTMSTLCDVNAADWVCWYRDEQLPNATFPAYYDINRSGFGQTRYGGPGE